MITMLRLLSLSGVALASFALGACGADSARAPDSLGAIRCNRLTVGETCDRDEQCDPHLHCILADPADPKTTCQPVSGQCIPGADPRTTCFRGARCEATTATSGLCTFSPVSPVFFATDRELTVLGPDDRFTTHLQAGQRIAGGFSFRWEAPALRADAITVVAVLSKPPRRSPVGNRIANVEDIVWMWTSDTAEDGAAQTVDISAGRAGVRPDGTVSTTRVQGLGAAEYFWIAFTIEQGRVTASSRMRRLSVLPASGSLGSAGMCEETEAQCVARMGGVSEDWACVHGQCVPRCSSDLDCVARGMRCELAVPYCGLLGRNSGYCGERSTLPPVLPDGGLQSGGDAGAGPDA